MATNLLENFHLLLVKNRFFSKFKISTLKISSAIPLPRFERGSSGLPYAYILHGVLFLLDLLQYTISLYMGLYSDCILWDDCCRLSNGESISLAIL